MTLREAEDIAVLCRREAATALNRMEWRQEDHELHLRCAEAIEYLLRELAEAEGYAEWLEVNPS